ncbi:hypothetical protein [Nostoc sp. 'Peltigera malacea cyanobiont' DB3992]|uniref:hypothetical protein n=1 Tax=Nostoc sp. 'Peltigera malacea cyanobiont' DB3992 TaxID=1206980 RepID=UPI000C0547F6|nr:hypothetical protein [Nostoc sp. 'Peltigera malacea cyanobiont' DB3992]PHM07632.1 hypothetical protein CK516_25820 [Nostoc sp. 'Peltigera malacea cyanobiont' DB3992]
MSKKHNFGTVNRILGERPRLGPFPADQIFPWTLIAVVNVFIFNYLLKTSWLGTGLSIAWGWATWWTISTNKDFFGKFVSVPRISRGYMRFQSIQQKSEVGSRKKISSKF